MSSAGTTALASGGPPNPVVAWLTPQEGFTAGSTITLSVQADRGSFGDPPPVNEVFISATWGTNGSAQVCDLTQPDAGTTDHYSCTWNFQDQGHAIPTGTVTFQADAVDGSGDHALTQPTVSGTFTGGPSLQEYLQASNAAYGLDSGSFSQPGGMTVLDTAAAIGHGFEAVALQDAQGNIIIANEGWQLPPLTPATGTPYENGSTIAMGQILKGISPPALNDAVKFAQRILADKQRQSLTGNIYVTGHDLGGVEAQAEALALPSDIVGGATFGAPGLPTNAASSGQNAPVNYVDYGDPIGFWASDTKGPLQALAPATMNHYGSVQKVGNIYNIALIGLAAGVAKEQQVINDALNPMSWLADTFKNEQPVIKTVADKLKWNPFNSIQLNKRVAIGLTVATYSPLAAGIPLFHGIGQYAADLAISLKPTVAPPISPEEYVKRFDPQATTTELKDAQATTVNPNGTLTSPEFDTAFDPQTGQILDETYIANDTTTYDATFDASALVSSIRVNENTGGSYQLFNDDFNTHLWSSYANFYDGKDETGTLFESLYNWHAGGSQVQLFTGLPKGDIAELLDYSGPDGTGTLLSTQFIQG